MQCGHSFPFAMLRYFFKLFVSVVSCCALAERVPALGQKRLSVFPKSSKRFGEIV